MFDARAEHLKELDLFSQIRLAKVDPTIPFHRERKGYSFSKATKYGRYPPFSPLSQHLPIYREIFQVYCSVEPTIGQGVTGFNKEFHSFPHEKVPIYYEIGHNQLKDKELLIYDPLDLTITDSWALERDKSEQANSPI